MLSVNFKRKGHVQIIKTPFGPYVFLDLQKHLPHPMKRQVMNLEKEKLARYLSWGSWYHHRYFFWLFPPAYQHNPSKSRGLFTLIKIPIPACHWINWSTTPTRSSKAETEVFILRYVWAQPWVQPSCGSLFSAAQVELSSKLCCWYKASYTRGESGIMELSSIMLPPPSCTEGERLV